jgi:hypothetical protein
VPTEEDLAVFRAERLKAAKRRSLCGDRPSKGAALDDILREPLPQCAVNAGFEIVDRAIRFEGTLEIPFACHEHLRDERLELAPLRLDLRAIGRVQGRSGRECKAKRIDVRQRLAVAAGGDRGDDLVGRAGQRRPEA